MSKQKYLKFKSDNDNDIYIDIYRIESFEQNGDVLIIHKYSGLFSRILYDVDEFRKLLREYQS